MPATATPTTSSSSMDRPQNIVGPGFLPTQIPKPKHVALIPTTQDLKGALTAAMRLEEISLWSYITASLFTWIQLAGFLIIPSSFSNLEESGTNSTGLMRVLHSIRNVPMYVAFFPPIPLLRITKDD